MQNLPSNRKNESKVNRYTTPTGKTGAADTTPDRAKKVVTGEVTRRKKPLTKRFAETFLGGEGKGVMEYVMMDVLIPAAKDAIADAVSQGVERKLFGEVRSVGRRTGQRPGHTPYNRMSSPYRPDPAQRPALSARGRATHNFEEVVVKTRPEAEGVINALFDRLEAYGTVSVADLYDMLDVTSNYVDRNWGWDDLSDADVKRVRDGYLLDLPKPIPLNR